MMALLLCTSLSEVESARSTAAKVGIGIAVGAFPFMIRYSDHI